MADTPVIRVIIETSRQFKTFWKEKGPFKYALTSQDFPPVLLSPEEWLFSNDKSALLKELMQFDQKKMRVVHAPFNPKNKAILRPETLSAWKITHFPEPWDALMCDLFVPQGHLTLALFDRITALPEKMDAQSVERLFFDHLETCLEQMGYGWFSPNDQSRYADIRSYLDEWTADEHEAGLL
jgi:hypothetical protein